MELSTSFLIYATLFRLAVIAAGLQSFISYERQLAYSDHDNDRFSVGVRLDY
jgi:hypothetical protein